ncbi:MAG: macro domain-containing protein [Sedimentibacter sp.]|uniref:macro domain-containing protein n=1 Tax=Sedimentibacter sp. TaxID=1960295 RepID=UPI0031595F03
MPFEIVRNDITKMKVDAVVNAANSALKMGGGVCGAVFNAAGWEQLSKECDSIGGCSTGEAVITGGYKLPARYIIHTVGPIWQGGDKNEEQLLRNCYLNSLELAKQYGVESIAFPLISSGIYGYPKDKALRVAVAAISEFLLHSEIKVFLAVFDKTALSLSGKLFKSIREYIDDTYAEEKALNDEKRKIQSYELQEAVQEEFLSDSILHSVQAPPSGIRKLEDVVAQLDETFSNMLFRLIDEKGKTDVDTYKKANIDRKLFSKIRSDKNYRPRKSTALALAISLELNLDESKDLLGKAGYAISHSSKFDIIVEYFIQEGNYNIFEINEALFAFDQPLLGV